MKYPYTLKKKDQFYQINVLLDGDYNLSFSRRTINNLDQIILDELTKHFHVIFDKVLGRLPLPKEKDLPKDVKFFVMPTLDALRVMFFNAFIDLGITQREFAENNKVDPAMVHRWLNFSKPITYSAVEKALQFAGLRIVPMTEKIEEGA